MRWQAFLFGVEEFLNRFRMIDERAVGMVGEALWEEAQIIFGESQRQVPVRFGFLRASGHVTAPEIVGKSTVSVSIRYGGPAVPYAVIVHERPDVWHAPPTKSKFLEDPVDAAVRGMEQRIAARIGHALLGE